MAMGVGVGMAEVGGVAGDDVCVCGSVGVCVVG